LNPTESRPGGSAASAQNGLPGSSAALEDSRIVTAMEEYQAALDAGNPPDRQEFLDRHLDLAPILAECLEGLAFVHQMGPRLQQSGESDVDIALLGAKEIQPESPLGDFRIVREIGRGGMGVVYEAVQISLGRRVALKVLPFAAALDSKQLQRFKNEAQAAAHLHHTNIVPVYAVGCERGVHYYAMQYIEGQTLAQVIADLRLQIADLHNGGEVIEERPGPISKSAICNLQSAIVPTHPVAGLSTEHSIQSAAYFRTLANLGIQAAEALETISKRSGSSEAMQSAIPEKAARQLQQPQVVEVMFVVAHQDGSAFRQPREGPLHHPAPWFVPPLARTGRRLLFADGADVSGIARGGDRLASGGIIVGLVQAQVLRLLRRRLRPLHHDGRDGGTQQLGIVTIGPVDDQSERPALLIDQQTAFGALFATIGGVFAHLFPPPKRALPKAPSALCHFQETAPRSAHCATKRAQICRKTPC
jgi:hypothetical protein